MTLKDELIESIRNEERQFDMSRWNSADGHGCVGWSSLPTCKTACCLAGHIEALRPKLAKNLANSLAGDLGLDHEGIARAIWEKEMGEDCRLDFRGASVQEKYWPNTGMEGISRSMAIAHIRGRSKRWPLLREGAP